MAIFASMARQPGQADPKDGHTDFFAVCSRSGEAVFKALKLAYDVQKELGVSPITATPFRGPVTWHHKVFFMGAPNVDSQRTDPAFNRRMRDLYDAYVKKFSDAGFPPYRTNPGSQDLLAAQFSFGNGSLLRFQEALKDGIDPNGILAPGRYGVWPKRLRPSRA
jgi:(+)-pinoresinol hydroxylase